MKNSTIDDKPLESLKVGAIIHTSTDKIVIKGSIKAMHDIFPDNHFIRVHKSFIMAMPQISRIEQNRIVLSNTHIPIGRNYKEELEKN
ncbi:hypothetical protein GCM10028806_03440 [Spirosoma terrae]|uniref:LytTR family transcriptional regulator n=1 Tax=Spirosoma terrae TaxID=1968276 RepID=A0A6L9LHL9_9BACT|nr:LytTR family DNA-binding domain-containing protein [Spirosoma terrae]NDU98098.1 LytTR family transcriptional regulator [Spirosoma terrae]